MLELALVFGVTAQAVKEVAKLIHARHVVNQAVKQGTVIDPGDLIRAFGRPDAPQPELTDSRAADTPAEEDPLQLPEE